MNNIRIFTLSLFVASLSSIAVAQSDTERPSTCVPRDAKVFIADMPQDFHTFITAAFNDTELPLFIVTDRTKADFEISGTASESQRNSWARVIFAGQTGSKESASIAMSNLRTGIVVFSAASVRRNAKRGKRSVANKMARELRDKIKKDARMGCKL